MADANQKKSNEKQKFFSTRSSTKENPKSEKKHQPAKAPLCHHHYGDCEADIPEEVLQNAGVPRGLYCETPEEERFRMEEQVCWYDEYYHPE